MAPIPLGAQRGQVLLVEDDATDALLLREMLDEGAPPAFRVTRAACLNRALWHLARQPFDVVLLDLVLPDSSGLATLAAVRAQAGRIPIIILSALDEEPFRLSAVQAGAQDYLVKGEISPQLLVRTLRYALERQRSEAALQASEERFRRAFDYARAGMGLVSPAGHWVKVNRTLCQIVGCAEPELLTQPFQAILDAEDLAAHGGELQQLLNGQRVYWQGAIRCRTRARPPRAALLSISRVEGPPGERAYFICLVQDLAPHPATEAALGAAASLTADLERERSAADACGSCGGQAAEGDPLVALGEVQHAAEWACARIARGAVLTMAEWARIVRALSAAMTTVAHALPRDR